MAPNVGTLDRLLRIALGLALLYLAFFDSVLAKYGAAAIGIVMLLVAALRVCPIYSALGVKTCRR